MGHKVSIAKYVANVREILVWAVSKKTATEVSRKKATVLGT